MNRLALIGATLAVLLCAAVAIAASPQPSSSLLASASPKSSGEPGATSSLAPSASPGTQTWTSDVNPVEIQGTATITKQPDGTGLLTLQLTGMVDEQSWTVDVQPGPIQRPNDGNVIAFKQGTDVSKVAPDKIQVTMSVSEMRDFEHALSTNSGGVSIFVSDGHRLAAANITAQAQ